MYCYDAKQLLSSRWYTGSVTGGIAESWFHVPLIDGGLNLCPAKLKTEVGKTFRVDILCGYALSSFHGEEDEHVFQSICAEHSAVYSQ